MPNDSIVLVALFLYSLSVPWLSPFVGAKASSRRRLKIDTEEGDGSAPS